MFAKPREQASGARVRAVLLAALLLGICAGCSAQLSQPDFERQQNEIDQLAQKIITSVARTLGAKPSGDGVVGLGSVVSCKGSSDKVAYGVNAVTLSYTGISNRNAVELIAKDLESFGVKIAHSDASGVRGNINSFPIDATPAGMGTNPAGMSITIGFECANVGQPVAYKLSQQPDRTIRVVSE